MSEYIDKAGLAIFTLFLVPIALAGVAIAAMVVGGSFATPVLITVLILAVLFLIGFYSLLIRLYGCFKWRK